MPTHPLLRRTKPATAIRMFYKVVQGRSATASCMLLHGRPNGKQKKKLYPGQEAREPIPREQIRFVEDTSTIHHLILATLLKVSGETRLRKKRHAMSISFIPHVKIRSILKRLSHSADMSSCHGAFSWTGEVWQSS